MAVGDLVTGDWMLEFNSLALGGETPYALVLAEGFVDLPGVRSSDRQVLRRHGLHPGDDFLLGREVTLTFEVYADTDADLATYVAAFQDAFRPGRSEAPLVFQFPGVAGGNKARVNVRHRGLAAPVNLEWHYRIPRLVARLAATDPRVYANAETSASTSLPSAGGGLNFDAVADFTFGAVSTGGTITAENAGTFGTPVTFRIDGPATDPRVENLTTGESLGLDVTVADGDYLVIDTAARTVLLNGTASRYSSLVSGSSFFDLEPGENELTFRAATTTTATLTAAWRSAWV